MGKRRFRNYHLDQLLFPEVKFLHVVQAKLGSLMIAVCRFRKEHGPEKMKAAGIGNRLNYSLHPDGSITIWKEAFDAAPKRVELPKKGQAHFVMENPKQYDELFVNKLIKGRSEKKVRKVQKVKPEKTIQEIVSIPVYEGPRESSDTGSKKRPASTDTDATQGLFENLLFE